jgi:hypothetical protein
MASSEVANTTLEATVREMRPIQRETKNTRIAISRETRFDKLIINLYIKRYSLPNISI